MKEIEQDVTAHRVRIGVVLAVLAVCLAVALDLARNGLATGGPCDWGFGSRQHAVHDSALRDLFSEPLPAVLHNPVVRCHSWTDFSLAASFNVSQDEARALVAALEQTYLTPQNSLIVPDSTKHRWLIGPPTHSTYVYELPGVGRLQFRTVRVTIPVDDKPLARVELDGGTL